MTELPDDVQALLTQARLDQPRVSPAVRARVRLGVERVLAAPTLPTKLVWKLAVPSVAAISALTAVLLTPAAPPPSRPMPHAVEVAPSAPHAPREPEPAARVEPLVEPPVRAARPVREETLGAELVLIERADRALRDGDAVRASDVLLQHRLRYRHGQLAHERDQLSVLADCLLGKPGAEEHARELMRKPSLLRARLAKACELEP